MVISNLDIFPLISMDDIVSHAENYWSVWRQTDKINNVSFEGLDINHPNSSFLIRCYTSDNVCLDFHNYRYSKYITDICALP